MVVIYYSPHAVTKKIIFGDRLRLGGMSVPTPKGVGTTPTRVKAIHGRPEKRVEWENIYPHPTCTDIKKGTMGETRRRQGDRLLFLGGGSMCITWSEWNGGRRDVKFGLSVNLKL